MITRYAAELATAGTTAAIGIVTMIGATEYGIGWGKSGPDPGTFPFYTGLVVALASAGIVAQAVVARGKLAMPFLTAAQLRPVLAFSLPILGFVIASLVLGLYVATALYLLATMVLQAKYRLRIALPIAIAVPVALYFLLEKAFQVSLLKGPLEAALGL